MYGVNAWRLEWALLLQILSLLALVMQLSPDGKSLAFLAPSKDKDVLNVWVRPIDNEEAGMVTKDELRGIRCALLTASVG